MFSRCLPALALASLVLLLASPFASAQLTPPFRVEASPAAADVYPGEAAHFTISVHNDAPILDRTASMNVTSQLPPDWTYSFSADPLNVTHDSFSNTTLSIFVPDDAAAQTVTVTYEAS